jgi:hypothetical protein
LNCRGHHFIFNIDKLISLVWLVIVLFIHFFVVLKLNFLLLLLLPMCNSTLLSYYDIMLSNFTTAMLFCYIQHPTSSSYHLKNDLSLKIHFLFLVLLLFFSLLSYNTQIHSSSSNNNNSSYYVQYFVRNLIF